MEKYNYRKCYGYLNIPLSVYCGSPYLNLPHIQIDDSTRPIKSARYNSDTLPYAISVTYENYVIALNNPSYHPQLIEPNYNDTDTLHMIMSDNACSVMTRRGYCFRFHDGKIF